MRAVLTDLSVPRYLATAASHRLGLSVGGLLSLRDDLPEPALPDAPGWVRLRPELTGICGSDVGVAKAKSSLVLSAFYTARRQILGHEIVAVTDEGRACRGRPDRLLRAPWVPAVPFLPGRFPVRL